MRVAVDGALIQWELELGDRLLQLLASLQQQLLVVVRDGRSCHARPDPRQDVGPRKVELGGGGQLVQLAQSLPERGDVIRHGHVTGG
ncbi:hypothetical protein FHX82_001154 [Amycolatopsis bartoniae]|nr:hypothetical protein [Amycolatopsis bartoniae]MBB2934134.1 hypothetical protein [Amycolatopsis bartoniae]